MLSSEGSWELLVRRGGGEPVCEEVSIPRSLEELRSSLGVEADQELLARHQRHTDQEFVVESVHQLHDGAEVSVRAPRRRVFVSVPPDTRKKAVVWFQGATAEEIERAISRAVGFAPGTPIHLMDGDATVVLSQSIPNGTHLDVLPATDAQWRGAADSTRQPVVRHLRTGASREPQRRSPALAEPRGARGAFAPPLRQEGSPTRGSPGRRLRSVGPAGVAPDVAAAAATAHSASACSGGAAAPSSPHSSEASCIHVLAGHAGFISCLCSVGDIVFTGSQDCSIMIWDLNNLQYIGCLLGHRGFVKSMIASYTKKIMVSGSQDRTIRVWSLETFATVKTLLRHTAEVNALLIIEEQDMLLSGSEDRSLRVWDLKSFALLVSLEHAHVGGIFALAPCGPDQVVSGARDRSLKVWETDSWHAVRTLQPPHYDGVTSVATADRHCKLYSGSRDRSIKEWDVTSLTNTRHTLHAHGDWVQALCMSQSSNSLFSGSRDSVIKVWDSELQCRDELRGHRGPVSALMVVGSRLFSASHDRTVRVWRIDQHE